MGLRRRNWTEVLGQVESQVSASRRRQSPIAYQHPIKKHLSRAVPSEHAIDGLHADMEIHFVHKSEKSRDVVVVAIMVYADSKKPTVKIPLYTELPKQINEAAKAKNLYGNPADLLPIDRRYFTYRGSFTTPPCTEGVQWIVMKSPIVIRPEVLTAFKRAIGRNNRPIQNRNNRKIRSTLSPKRDSP